MQIENRKLPKNDSTKSSRWLRVSSGSSVAGRRSQRAIATVPQQFSHNAQPQQQAATLAASMLRDAQQLRAGASTTASSTEAAHGALLPTPTECSMC